MLGFVHDSDPRKHLLFLQWNPCSGPCSRCLRKRHLRVLGRLGPVQRQPSYRPDSRSPTERAEKERWRLFYPPRETIARYLKAERPVCRQEWVADIVEVLLNHLFRRGARKERNVQLTTDCTIDEMRSRTGYYLLKKSQWVLYYLSWWPSPTWALEFKIKTPCAFPSLSIPRRNDDKETARSPQKTRSLTYVERMNTVEILRTERAARVRSNISSKHRPYSITWQIMLKVQQIIQF